MIDDDEFLLSWKNELMSWNEIKYVDKLKKVDELKWIEEELDWWVQFIKKTANSVTHLNCF